MPPEASAAGAAGASSGGGRQSARAARTSWKRDCFIGVTCMRSLYRRVGDALMGALSGYLEHNGVAKRCSDVVHDTCTRHCHETVLESSPRQLLANVAQDA